jgi:hypothetical protein
VALPVGVLALLAAIGLVGGIGISAVCPGGVLPTIRLFALTPATVGRDRDRDERRDRHHPAAGVACSSGTIGPGVAVVPRAGRRRSWP